ncbi:MAG: zinc transporter ZupT [Alistipes sp.]|nr:zinc transporter ZupT [Alistipes sp.]
MQNTIFFAFILTLCAGLATGIGSGIAFFANHTNKKFLSFSLGVSAGVMIYVSFVEILHGAQIGLDEILGGRLGKLVCAAAFFGGMMFSALIDKLVPSQENPHEARPLESMARGRGDQKLIRTGVLTALIVGIHNFPEGIATFMAAVDSPQIGIAIAVAIAIHNIPEGIAISVPVYFATQSRRRAFWYSFLSGLAEPVGAIVGYFILYPFLTPLLLHCIFAVIAGIMVFISVDELLPAAEEYGEHHISIYGLLTGMAVMAISLILLG